MKKLLCCLVLVPLVFQLFGCGGAPSETAPSGTVPSEAASSGESVSEQSSSQLELLADAYIFTFPLVLLDATAQVFTNTQEATSTRAPLNQFIHSRGFVRADTKAVTTPNVDTLYTQSYLDLSADALVFHKPAADRFFSIELLDAFTNSAAILGTGSNEADPQAEQTYLITGPDFSGEVPTAMTQVAMPTNAAWMLARIVASDNEEDLNKVYELQAQMHLVPLSAYQINGFDYEAPLGTVNPDLDYVPVDMVLSLDAETFFARANALMEVNSPADIDAPQLERIAAIGVGPGLTFDTSSLADLPKDTWQQQLIERLVERSVVFTVQNGVWSTFGDPIAEYGTAYDYRALIALNALGANPTDVAVYPKASTDESGEPLDGANMYRIHFEKDMLPPVKEFGFWSITAYGQDNFLIANEINRYLINDRSDLVFNEDGSLDILLQTQAPDDERMMGNWLPTGTGPFHLHMRIYLPGDAVLDQSWPFPTITKIA